MTVALGIDVGTTNVKAVLVADDGRLIGSAARQVAASIDGAVAELDAEAQWEAVVDVVQQLTAAHPIEAAAVGAIGVDSQYSSIVPIDAAARPTAPMRLWSDRRGTDRSFDILGKGDDVFFLWIERHGIPTVGGGLSLGHILHLQHDTPGVHAATTAYVEPMDYVNARLTGRIAANQATMFMSQLIDNRTLGVTAYDDELVALADVDPSRLPELLPLDEPVGPLLPKVAELLGLPATAIVYAGINDTHAGAVAADAFSPGRAGLSIGTTSVMSDAMGDKAVDLDHEVLSTPGPFDDSYLVFAENGLGGKPLEHVLEQIVYARDRLADHRPGVDGGATDVLETSGGSGRASAFDALDAALATVEPGSRGLLFLPWLRGSMAPANDANMRGGFINMSLETGRAEMVRAVCEGVAHNLAWLLPHVEALTGTPIDEFVFLGGAAKSPQWTQIIADVLDRRVRVPDAPEVAIARGVALLALHRHGTLTRTELSAACVAGVAVDPRPHTRAVYAKHQPQFEAAFEALRPISNALAAP